MSENNFEGNLKYRIKEILGGYPPVLQLQKKATIMELCKINKNTMSRWLNATDKSTQDIQGYDLAIIAHVLGTTVADLYAPKVVKKVVTELAFAHHKI